MILRIRIKKFRQHLTWKAGLWLQFVLWLASSLDKAVGYLRLHATVYTRRYCECANCLDQRGGQPYHPDIRTLPTLNPALLQAVPTRTLPEGQPRPPYPRQYRQTDSHNLPGGLGGGAPLQDWIDRNFRIPEEGF